MQWFPLRIVDEYWPPILNNPASARRCRGCVSHRHGCRSSKVGGAWVAPTQMFMKNQGRTRPEKEQSSVS